MASEVITDLHEEAFSRKGSARAAAIANWMARWHIVSPEVEKIADQTLQCWKLNLSRPIHPDCRNETLVGDLLRRQFKWGFPVKILLEPEYWNRSQLVFESADDPELADLIQPLESQILDTSGLCWDRTAESWRRRSCGSEDNRPTSLHPVGQVSSEELPVGPHRAGS